MGRPPCCVVVLLCCCVVVRDQHQDAKMAAAALDRMDPHTCDTRLVFRFVSRVKADMVSCHLHVLRVYPSSVDSRAAERWPSVRQAFIESVCFAACAARAACVREVIKAFDPDLPAAHDTTTWLCNWLLACRSWLVAHGPWQARATVAGLAKCGADVGVDSRFEQAGNRTALHLAAYDGNAAFAELLLEHGADPAAVDEWGMTPLHIANGGGFSDIARMLLKHGDAAAAKDMFGRTPRDMSTGERSGHSLLQDGPNRPARAAAALPKTDGDDDGDAGSKAKVNACRGTPRPRATPAAQDASVLASLARGDTWGSTVG